MTTPGTLYIVSTPIGNLEDLTLRALRILQEVSVIAAEDTRRTQKLCNHFGIHTTLTSYHDFNKEEKTPILLKRLEEGESIALVSDAGTPLIADPGYYLVTRAINQQLPITAIPGPCAALAALSISGLPTDTFSFYGFLPRKHNARLRLLQELSTQKSTIILFETPHRIHRTLDMLKSLFGERRMVLMRELTKTHEEVLRGSVAQIAEVCQNRMLKGEITLVIEGKTQKKKNSSKVTMDPNGPFV